MLNINFVPDDYVQSNESNRTNLLYLILFAVVMLGLSVSFIAIKIRQRAINAKEQIVNTKMAQTQKAIKQFEQLQEKRKKIMSTAITTAALIEPVPRSILLASLTNNLPTGASLLKVRIIQKQSSRQTQTVKPTKYDSLKANQKSGSQQQTIDAIASPEKNLDTFIEIEGISPSDLEVAEYIENLSNANLFARVALVESKEYKFRSSKSQDSYPQNPFRQFKLTAILDRNVHLTEEDIRKIAANQQTNIKL